MSTVQTIVGGLLAVALVAAVAVLTWHGSIDGQAAIGFFSGVGIGGVTVGAHTAGLRSAARIRATAVRGTATDADTYEGS